MKDFIIKYKWGLIAASLVGFICILPQILFIISLGDEFRGVHLLRTPNEEGYIAIAQEILDGHPGVASMPFFEYKEVGVPLLPSTLFRIFTVPVQIFNIPVVDVIIVGKFLFPAFLFFIIYLLLNDLIKTENEEEKKLKSFFAIVAGILIVFGFDLVDYNSIISYAMGRSSPEGFLIWTRPVNPISGAILLFLFLFCLNKFNFQKKIIFIFFCGVSLALMMASYVFSWTLAIVVLGLYFFSRIIQKKLSFLIGYASIFILGVLFSLPYWINIIRASRLEWYKEAAARIGMFHAYAPHFNRFIMAMIVFFLAVSFFAYYKKILFRPLPSWWWFSAALLLSSLIVYNQQVITGKEIWYYHYVFYTIPFGYTVFMLLLWYVWRVKYPKITLVLVTIVLIASISLGVFQQASAYTKRAPEYAKIQYYRNIFDFFNNKAGRDSVILVNEKKTGLLNVMIPAFTHCNLYYSSENQSVLADPDDFYYRYLSVLRVKNIRAEEIERYMLENKIEVENALQYQLQRTLGFPDPKLEQRLLNMPKDYREFVTEDFYTQLSRFRIDYIMSEGTLDDGVLQLLPNLKEVYTIHGIVIYKFLP